MILMCISAGAQNNKMTHDMTEFYTPEVPVVTPGTDLKGGGFTAPSDAIVLFDGKDLSKWENTKGGQEQRRYQDEGHIQRLPAAHRVAHPQGH